MCSVKSAQDNHQRAEVVSSFFSTEVREMLIRGLTDPCDSGLPGSASREDPFGGLMLGSSPRMGSAAAPPTGGTGG